ncbi:hypothetical protein EMIHUDRAFT_445300 [Emiliania huxleyi CCMP1516]|uniref:Uncharacterized protein n=2 Tax=Emiliania huxleyi TaxID=2903 RepID=A0A0D3J0I1_EMIH1|nr:hypothetical protein EMIHUDRAFT_445300 [Emiliania huxleyi CCMP1516]EOD17016.1 hypothetical protein EMIHUDRAFT_445300 [Emiliania huxleyi CCMP1516]|eukprot:XP_005769445.1 hypothetical protein EMIHUDRAFT_445300 [Emiliania huxleyi CCMP1516]
MAPWDFLFEEKTYKVGKNGVSPIQNMAAYLGGSAIQTVGDNPVTAYRQLVQQYAKNLAGETVAPAVATAEANAVFIAAPFTASMSGLWPRLIGVLFKRIPKFGVLLGYTYLSGNDEPGYAAATAASILSAPFINPVRMVEKQQRAFLKQTGTEKPIMEILGEASSKYFAPLFRGTVPLMGHSLASAVLGLVAKVRAAADRPDGTAVRLRDQPRRVGRRLAHLRGRHQPALPPRGHHADQLDQGQVHRPLRGCARARCPHGQVWPQRHLPRPGHRHLQGHHIADALPRGPPLPHAPVQGVQRPHGKDPGHRHRLSCAPRSMPRGP